MSHPPGLLTSVTSLAEAERACANGADILDVGQDADLAVAVRGALDGTLLGGQVEGVDYTICDDPARAEQSGLPASRLVVTVAAAEVERYAHAAWRTMVDVDNVVSTADPDGAAAAALAAVCAWQGAAIVRTRHVREVRRSLDMTASIAGIRPPAWAVRGLALWPLSAASLRQCGTPAGARPDGRGMGAAPGRRAGQGRTGWGSRDLGLGQPAPAGAARGRGSPRRG